ncbi:MAG TPA: UDP-N-acetylmuramoyl-tripeptide--D-alanyl-D-alanine ligase [Burkholderiaceae bacterium]|nr:UDP-N-acetylmuramoyl-tripeptide--D-alanyl-D-alanine ligase [Burkholderiaceae bacterium]HQR71848.1 UDP-N-acetylmuramoyl-tripeptide--D-alanyl-D-alanine ligase [Burkholderiaceae bacterium]
MSLMSVAELAAAVSANAVLGDGATAFSSVSTDTRTLEPGALFVALRGDRFDGHDYARRAVELGAVALLLERALEADVPQIVVTDARRALGLGAADWRARFSLPVIAVAGSNGKTTVTQMIASILARAYGEPQRLATRGNLNNEIGVPLMLWQLTKRHKAAVLELGMNHPGEIAWLAQLMRPTVALVNNAQREHQEFMQSVEATAHENGEVIAALPLDGAGVAVFPADDACAPIWRALAGTRRVIDFALEAYAVVTATYGLKPEGAHVSMATPAGLVAAELAVGGLHNVRNALAATACALAIGVPPRSISAGLEAFRPVGGRGVRLRTRAGALLIDDSYNANPDSVRAAIDLLAGSGRPRVLVLGDMGEVGERGPEFHREVGAYARTCQVDALFATGELTRETVAAFGAGGRHFESVEPLVAALTTHIDPTATVLVKGSRFMRMERVVQALAQPTTDPAAAGVH